jgi:glycoside/pentoside/hexuronide:cation symporter, GPH family
MPGERLALKEKIGYGFGDAASSMFWKLFSMYLMFFYTDVFGISAAVVGTMFLVTRLWDAAFDPLVGILADRTETRWGKFRPYLLWMAVPFGVIGVLTFTTPPFGAAGKIAYAYVTYSLMMTVYSLINVPYASLMGVMTADGSERTSLATFRFIFAFGGSFVVLGIARPLADFFSRRTPGAPDPRLGWQLAAAVIALLALAQFLLTFAWTRERIRPVSASARLGHDLADLLKNKPWFILLGAGIATIFFNAIRDGAAIYYFKYFIVERQAFTMLGFTVPPSTLYFVLGQAANIVGVVLAKPMADRIGKKLTYLGAMASATVFSLAFYRVGKDALAMIYVLQALTSVSAGIIFPLLWSMYADTADYSEWRAGRRATGLVFSAASMSQKFGWAIGGALVGLLLGVFGFEANVAQAPRTLFGIRLMLSVFPAIGAGASALFMAVYSLDERTNHRIATDLAARRAATPPPA